MHFPLLHLKLLFPQSGEKTAPENSQALTPHQGGAGHKTYMAASTSLSPRAGEASAATTQTPIACAPSLFFSKLHTTNLCNPSFPKTLCFLHFYSSSSSHLRLLCCLKESCPAGFQVRPPHAVLGSSTVLGFLRPTCLHRPLHLAQALSPVPAGKLLTALQLVAVIAAVVHVVTDPELGLAPAVLAPELLLSTDCKGTERNQGRACKGTPGSPATHLPLCPP